MLKINKYYTTLLVLCLCGYTVAAQQPYCDVLIKNGKIIDGTGNNWYYGDIAVTKNKITAVGRNLQWNAAQVIDVKGMVIAPGFIDVHTHIEEDEKKEPTAKSFIYDGVTTCITGNCGSSNLNIEKYFNMADSLRMSVNVATLVGHNDVRKAVLGRANRAPSAEELQQMEQLVDKAMLQGAVGLSTGLIYIPGTYSKTDEIIALAKRAAKYNGVYASHIRNEGDNVTDAIHEAITIGEQAGLPVQISHFKVSGQQNWGRSKETLKLVTDARIRGLDVTIDQYPYTASSTSISTLIPEEILADGQDSIKARLSNPTIKKQVIEQMLKNLKRRQLKHFSYVVVTGYSKDTAYSGKSIEAINLLKGGKHTVKAEAEVIIDIMMNGGAGAVFHGMGEADVQYIMQYPFCMIASDASIRIMNAGMPHPRGYGTNARVLGRYVREQKLMPLEEAIRRMTSLPAQKFQLKDRGLLLPGMAADILVFDPEKVTDNATFEKPHAYSSGFEYVWVNGVLTVKNGVHTEARGGATLKGPAYVK